MPYDLTPEQVSIVELPPGVWLVTAPPGCGKTEVLVRRVEHLLETSGRKRSRVLVLTFTRRAAQNVVERVQRTLPTQVERVIANRFHQFCHEVMRQHAPDRVRHLYEGKAERLLALREALSEEGLEVPESQLEELLSKIELAKKTLAFESGAMVDELREPFDAYIRFQQRERICDFDDLILDVLALFRAGEWPVSAYRQLYSSILVDEAQDLNASQYALVSSLAGPTPSDLMFLADRRQSIFAFNGSNLGLLDKFVAEFHAEEKKLTLSFRCGRQIVRAANKVAKALKRSPGGLSEEQVLAEAAVRVLQPRNEFEEADAVVKQIGDLLRNGLDPAWCHEGERLALEPREIAILGRSRRILQPSEEALHRAGLHVVTSYGRDESLSSTPGLIALWLFRATAYPQDSIVRRRLLTTVFDDESVEVPSSFEETLNVLEQGNPLGAELAEAAHRADAEQNLVPAVLAILSRWKSDEGDDAEALRTDLEWLNQIQSRLRRKLQREPKPGEFTQELTMTSASPVEGPGVRVLTVHAAKGLEFRVVAIVGLRDGGFPDFRASTEKAKEEERRLAYVAITRASRLVIASAPRSWVTSYGNLRTAEPSIFFKEIA